MELTKTAQPYAFPAEHEHEWRMFTREPKYSIKKMYYPNFQNNNDYIEYTSKVFDGYEELWYCIKCRHEETRMVPDVR